MDEELLEDIYYSLQGLMTREAHIQWVENAFATGSVCDQAYSNMRDAYERACLRLGRKLDDGDRDLDEIVRSLEKIQDVLARKMFLLGMQYQEKSKNQPL